MYPASAPLTGPGAPAPGRPWSPAPAPWGPPIGNRPVWGPPVPAAGRGSTGVWAPPDRPAAGGPVVCDSCGATDRGEFCSHCGWALGSSKSVFRLTVESFLKVEATKRYATLYRTILRSPVAQTIRGFQIGRLADAVRFFELGAGFYFLCLAASGGTEMLGRNEFVRTAAGAVFPLVLWGVMYTLYYQWMRWIAPVRRSSQEFVKFLCLTQGLVFVPSAVSLLGTVGGVLALLLVVPTYVYLARTWAWFWGTSWVRCALVLVPCTVVGGLAGGFLVVLPIGLLGL